MRLCGTRVGATTTGWAAFTKKELPFSITAGNQGLNLTLTQKWQIVTARGNALLEMSGGGNSSTGAAYTGDVSAIGSFVGIAGESDTEVAELIAVKGTLSDGDLANIQAYYKQKYKLAN